MDYTTHNPLPCFIITHCLQLLLISLVYSVYKAWFTLSFIVRFYVVYVTTALLDPQFPGFPWISLFFRVSVCIRMVYVCFDPLSAVLTTILDYCQIKLCLDLHSSCLFEKVLHNYINTAAELLSVKEHVRINVCNESSYRQ
ncbi:hypothetical protein R3I94_008793 [Phoxinus phoxinus]